MTYSRMGNATLPSAMQRFTSEFGMGSGGSAALLSSGKTVVCCADKDTSESVEKLSSAIASMVLLVATLGCYMVKPHG